MFSFHDLFKREREKKKCKLDAEVAKVDWGRHECRPIKPFAYSLSATFFPKGNSIVNSIVS